MVHKVILIGMRVICIGLWGTAVFFFLRAFSRGGVAAALADFLFLALPLAVVSGLLFHRYILSCMADSLVERLLWSRERLPEAQVPLSPFYGGLSNGAYHAVRQEMRALPEGAFRDPEVVLLYAQACMNLPEYAHEGVETMETFFRHPRGRAEHILALLFYYADAAEDFRSPEAIAAVLTAVLKKSRFAEHEKNAIRARCAVLRQRRDV